MYRSIVLKLLKKDIDLQSLELWSTEKSLGIFRIVIIQKLLGECPIVFANCPSVVEIEAKEVAVKAKLELNYFLFTLSHG
jgi:hypothetical protein